MSFLDVVFLKHIHFLTKLYYLPVHSKYSCQFDTQNTTKKNKTFFFVYHIVLLIDIIELLISKILSFFCLFCIFNIFTVWLFCLLLLFIKILNLHHNSILSICLKSSVSSQTHNQVFFRFRRKSLN